MRGSPGSLARALGAEIRRGLLNRRSLTFLGAVGAVYAAIAAACPILIDPHADWDWLLGGIWTVMTIALAWDPRPARDVRLVVVGLVGGLVIEGWGTNTLLWSYFTDQRPPPWIIPAWPIAAVCIDRLARLLDRILPWIRRAGPAYWLVLPLFVVFFTTLMEPALAHPWSVGVLASMVLVVFVGARPDRDLLLFVTGASAGIFLEYWGTSRGCWTYWTHQVPPPQAVLAHGFASVAFARGVQLLDAMLGSLPRAHVPASQYGTNSQKGTAT